MQVLNHCQRNTWLIQLQLDRSNLTNAYVSGMKEDLDFKGNELTQINTVFTVGMLRYRCCIQDEASNNLQVMSLDRSLRTLLSTTSSLVSSFLQ
jgi:hypothetical protein